MDITEAYPGAARAAAYDATCNAALSAYRNASPADLANGEAAGRCHAVLCAAIEAFRGGAAVPAEREDEDPTRA